MSKKIVAVRCRFCYGPVMPKQHPIGVRLSDEERTALEAASEEKSLKLSAMVRMIVAEWLRKHGCLKRSRKP